MLEFVVKRILNGLMVLWLIITLTFMLLRLMPGGPFTMDRKLPPAILKNLETKYKLNDPLIVQYCDYFKGLFRGDLGPSFKYEDRTVNSIIADGAPVSFQLGIKSVLLSLLLGIPAGVISALKHGKWQDRILSLVTVAGIAIPGFIVASLLMIVLALKLNLLPTAMWGGWKYQVMPILALSLGPMAVITRLTRTSMLDVLGQDYIKLAYAKGLSDYTVLWKHALPNSLIPVVTITGPLIAGIVTGSFVIESIFAIPGVGKAFVTSIYNRDYTLILGMTIFYSALLIFLNIVVDIIYPLLDPRITMLTKKEA